jgi:branched-chain amino acid transport system ATP-binding protein
MSQQPVLVAENVSKSFGGVLALSGVDLHVYPGDVVGIIGPNGSGKTTLVNVLTGFIRADTGRITFKGRDITNWKPHKIADSGLTRTFQVMRPYYTLPAYKNLIIPLISRRARRSGGWRGGGKTGSRDTVAVDILEEIGFERDSYVPYKTASSLPTGYLKRLELARCLALRPDVIICDEVFSGLSMSEMASMVPLMERFQMEGITLVMVEHRLRELFRLATRVIVLNFGCKIAEGASDEVLGQKEVKEAYFGSEEVFDYV